MVDMKDGTKISLAELYQREKNGEDIRVNLGLDNIIKYAKYAQIMRSNEINKIANQNTQLISETIKLNGDIAQKDQDIAKLDQDIAQKDQDIAKLDQGIAELDQALNQ